MHHAPHLEERGDASLRAAVLVGLKVQQECGHLTVALPAGHEEGALAVVVWSLHIRTHLQEELGHAHVTLSVEGGGGGGGERSDKMVSRESWNGVCVSVCARNCSLYMYMYMYMYMQQVIPQTPPGDTNIHTRT